MKKILKLLLILFVSFTYVPILVASEHTLSVEGDKGYFGLSYNDSSGNAKNMYYANYVDEAGNDVYCIEPGRRGPEYYSTGVGGYYNLSDEGYFNYDKCSSEWKALMVGKMGESMAKSQGFNYLETSAVIRMGYIGNAPDSSILAGADGDRDSSKSYLFKDTYNALKNGTYDDLIASDANGILGTGGDAATVKKVYNVVLEAESTINNYCATGSGSSGGNVFAAEDLKNYTVTDGNVYVNGQLIATIPEGTQCDQEVNIPLGEDYWSIPEVSIYGRNDQLQYFMPGDEGGDALSIDVYVPCDEPDDACCSVSGIKNNVPMSCDSESSGIVEDPEMCSILDACDGGQKYNYTALTGLNDEICTVFCREEVLFTFMDKTEVIAGRQFKYDLSSKVDVTQALSTVVEGTRQCVSQIKYEEWYQEYLEKDKEVVNAWDKLKFWEAIYINHPDPDIIPESSSCCTCNLGPVNVCYWAHGQSFPYSSWRWSDGPVGLGTRYASTTDGEAPNCECDSDDNGTPNDSSDDTCSVTGSDSGEACDWFSKVYDSYDSAAKNYTKALEDRDEWLMDLQNCNLLPEIEFSYVSDKQSYYVSVDRGPFTHNYRDKNAYDYLVNEYTFDATIDIEYQDAYGDTVEIGKDTPSLTGIEQGWCADCKYEDYCGGCGVEPNINGGSTSDDILLSKCEGSETGANCWNEGVIVPINNAANLKVSKEQHFWQSQTYSTQLYTGIVTPSYGNGQGIWIGLEEYMYPIELNKVNGEYGVFVDYSYLGKTLKVSNEEFICSFEVINETTIFECDPTVDPLMNEYCEIECDPRVEECDNDPYEYAKLGYVVRSVDLTELFPTDRQKGMNWANSENVIKAIQSLGDKVYVDAKPQYVIELSPSNIRNIRRYNDGTSYLDYSISCDSSLNCRSDFLTQISNNSEYATYVDYTLGRNKTTDLYNNYYKYGRD